MNHHLAKSYRKKRFIFIAVVVLLFYFFNAKRITSICKSFFSKIISPIWQAENFTADFLAKSFHQKNDLYKQNILLKEELEKKMLKLIFYKI